MKSRAIRWAVNIARSIDKKIHIKYSKNIKGKVYLGKLGADGRITP